MRLVTVRDADDLRPAVLNDRGEVVFLDVLGFSTLLDVVEAGAPAWARVAELASHPGQATLDDPALRLEAPITRPPRNMFCVGVNYRSHWEEGDRDGAAAPQAPVFFTKPWTTIVPHGATVHVDPTVTQKTDWEAEIAMVIGRGGRDIAGERALDHVFGYLLANDLSARDVQLANGPTGQWFKGKSLDGYCPMGPHIVTPDDVPDPSSIEVALRVNGTLKQRFRSDQMIHSFAAIIASLSRGMALLPGDVILTGTSSGVGHWQEPPEYLGDGDLVEVTSNVLGQLTFRTATATVHTA